MLVLFLLLCYGTFYQVAAWNELSRYALVRALVDDHSLQIDRYAENTGDKSFYNGHYYSDKAPGASLHGVPVYAVQRLVGTLTGTGVPSEQLALHALTFFVSGVPTALLALLLLRFLRAYVEEWWALVVATGYALGTIAFAFATMYFGHATSAFFLFASFYFVWRARDSEDGWRLLVAGLSAGWAVLTEYPTAIGVAAILVYCVVLHRTHTMAFIAGGAPLAMILLGYNWAAFGHPLRSGYQYHVSFGEYHQRGFMGVGFPTTQALGDILTGPRGLLRLSPWFVATPLGLWPLWAAWSRTRRGTPGQTSGGAGLASATAACASVVVLFLLYNSGYALPIAGWTPGPRFLLPALPFAAVLVALAPYVVHGVWGWWVRLALSATILGLITTAIALNTIATATMPNAPELYTYPLTMLWWPRLVGRDLATTMAWERLGFSGLQPLYLLGLALVITGIGLGTTVIRRGGGRYLTQFCAGLLLCLVVFTASPFGGTGRLSAHALERIRDLRPEATLLAPGEVAIVDVGVSLLLDPRRDDGRPVVRPWAQIAHRNSDGAPVTTHVTFTIVGPDGSLMWVATHGNYRWQPGSRNKLYVEWVPTDVPSGRYTVNVLLLSPDGQHVHALAQNAATFVLER